MSSTSVALEVTIDTVPPPAPVIDSIADDSGSSGSDGITSDDDLLVSGSAEAGSTVTLLVDGTPVGSTVADPTTGAWSLQTGTLADGPHSLTATATDAAGNGSPVSAAFDVVIDTVAPGAPTIDGFSDDSGASPSDGITKDNDLLVQGSALAGSTVALLVDGASVGTATADATTGAWSIQTGVLADGPHALAATATDVAGNAGPASGALDVVIDTAAPAAPTIDAIEDDSGAPGDGVTRDNDLLVRGSAEAGATVELFLDGVSLGTVVADGTTGEWTVQTGVIPDGDYMLTAAAADAAGNTSAESSVFPIEIDTGPLLPGLFFTASTLSFGRELFRVGTDGSVEFVAEINPGPAGSNASYLTPFNGELYFLATADSGGH